MQKDFTKFRKVFTNLACSPLFLIANNLELAAKYLPNNFEQSITNSEINNTNNVLFQGFDNEQEKNLLFAENNEIFIDRRKVDLRAIRPNIIRLKAENPEGSVIIQADKASQTGLLVEAMDQIRLAGVQEISIAAEND